MEIAEIKQYLRARKITYEELSTRSSIPIGTLKSIFSGRTPNPRIDTVQAIERALGLSEWSAEEKAEGVGNHPTYLSADETEWLELRSEILRVFGQDYLDTLIALLQKNTEIFDKKK